MAALLPGGDPVTMLLMMLPILFLYEGSILLAAMLDRRAARARDREEEAEAADTELAPLRLRRLMLFDLRGSGRRRVVKIVYITLAFLMGGGLVLFGIGGGGALSGGLVDAITEGGGGDDGTDRLREQEQAATAKARANPTDAAMWAAVARARFNVANSGENVDQNTGNFTDEGAGGAPRGDPRLGGARQARQKKPDPRVASLMVQAYAALGDLDKATRGAGDHRGGPRLRRRVRHAGPARLPGRPDQHGRPGATGRST